MPGFTTFILKVAGRCNLNRSYCYMYKLIEHIKHYLARRAPIEAEALLCVV
jgi:hypothetical protein